MLCGEKSKENKVIVESVKHNIILNYIVWEEMHAALGIVNETMLMSYYAREKNEIIYGMSHGKYDDVRYGMY